MSKLRCGAAFLVTVAAQAIGQSVLGLAVTETHRLSSAGQLVLPFRCASNGAIYGRFPSGGPPLFQVLEFAPDGSQKGSYSYLSDPELKAAFLEDFAVTGNGEVYELAEVWKNRVFVVTFSGDGQIANKSELVTRHPVNLSHIVALPEDRIFVSGSLVGDEHGNNAGKPFNAIFDRSGKLLREITLGGDPKPKEAKAADRKGDGNPAVKWGRTVAGDDGNLYVMRQRSPAVVYVVSQAGSVQRKLTIAAPVEKALPIELEVNGGRLAIEFSVVDAPDVGDTRIRIVNAQTGQNIADYSVTAELGEALTCYRADGEFTFLRETDGWPRIIQAAGR